MDRGPALNELQLPLQSGAPPDSHPWRPLAERLLDEAPHQINWSRLVETYAQECLPHCDGYNLTQDLHFGSLLAGLVAAALGIAGYFFHSKPCLALLPIQVILCFFLQRSAFLWRKQAKHTLASLNHRWKMYGPFHFMAGPIIQRRLAQALERIEEISVYALREESSLEWKNVVESLTVLLEQWIDPSTRKVEGYLTWCWRSSSPPTVGPRTRARSSTHAREALMSVLDALDEIRTAWALYHWNPEGRPAQSLPVPPDASFQALQRALLALGQASYGKEPSTPKSP